MATITALKSGNYDNAEVLSTTPTSADTVDLAGYTVTANAAQNWGGLTDSAGGGALAFASTQTSQASINQVISTAAVTITGRWNMSNGGTLVVNNGGSVTVSANGGQFMAYGPVTFNNGSSLTSPANAALSGTYARGAAAIFNFMAGCTVSISVFINDTPGARMAIEDGANVTICGLLIVASSTHTSIAGVVAAANVRNGTARYSGGGNGSAHIPVAADVRYGVNVDATTGVYVRPPSLQGAK